MTIKTAQELGREPIAFTKHTIVGELGCRTYGTNGLTKREFFATQAPEMPGQWSRDCPAVGWEKAQAQWAVAYADALLEELAKQ